MGMFPIKDNTSSSTTSDLTTNNCSNSDLNVCMCFVTNSFSPIFNVWSLFLKYILVITSLASYNLMILSIIGLFIWLNMGHNIIIQTIINYE